VETVTFGCRLNAYESAAIEQAIAEAGGPADGDRPLVVVNTCAVTAEAERQARQAIRRLARERPEARIVVTGCAAEVAPKPFGDMPEVDRLLGNRAKLKPGAWAAAGLAAGPPPPSGRGVDAETEARPLAGFQGRARAFVQVQTGCDHRCTFCIIPYGRGDSRSVAAGEVVERVRALVAAGHREVVLSGVDLTSWGRDLPGRPSLGQLARRLLLLVPTLARLRFSSLDPQEIDDDLIRLVADEPRVMPHLHLSLQAGDDLVLKRMKRRHDRAGAVALCRRLRTLRPDIVFGADLIAGFPTESEAAFANTLAILDDCGIAHAHVFPYSERPGTPAARMPAVAKPVRRARAARLRARAAARLAALARSRLGTVARVLVESDGEGLSEHGLKVRVPGAAAGSIVAVRLDAVRPDGGLDGVSLEA
jgi:threonylcarbamoyladenosine tRNA methylthiotransferase MtaB